jgi:putative DNA primase/helicase
MTDGGWTTARADRHPHPIAEAMRWHAAEGELLQIIGRARGADRTAANPVDVLMMCNTGIPIPVERLMNAAELAPTVVDRMLAAGGVALFSYADAARAYPGLWTTRDAARMAFNREGGCEHLDR